jgi:hypothetical protein
MLRNSELNSDMEVNISETNELSAAHAEPVHLDGRLLQVAWWYCESLDEPHVPGAP